MVVSAFGDFEGNACLKFSYQLAEKGYSELAVYVNSGNGSSKVLFRENNVPTGKWNRPAYRVTIGRGTQVIF